MTTWIYVEPLVYLILESDKINHLIKKKLIIKYITLTFSYHYLAFHCYTKQNNKIQDKNRPKYRNVKELEKRQKY